MYVACDINGVLIDVEDAISGGDYHCPSCGAQVIVKDGKVNAKHFAHVAGICQLH